MESGERSSAGQPELRARSASRCRRSHPPRPPRSLPPFIPSPRPYPVGRPARPAHCPRGVPNYPSAPSLPRATHRLYNLLLFLSRPGAWHGEPLPDARGPTPLFVPRLHLLPFPPSSNSYSNSHALSLHSGASGSAPATFHPVPKVRARHSCPHHGTVRLARASLHPGRTQRRVAGCRPQVEKLLGSATSLRVKRLQQERCPHA